jgi:hypothetical protein
MFGERREIARDQTLLTGLRYAVVAHRHRRPNGLSSDWSQPP